MEPLKEIGEYVINDGENKDFFRPSLINMTRIGEPDEIVQALYDLYNDEAGDMMRKTLKAFDTFSARLASHLASPQHSKKNDRHCNVGASDLLIAGYNRANR